MLVVAEYHVPAGMYSDAEFQDAEAVVVARLRGRFASEKVERLLTLAPLIVSFTLLA